MKNLINDTTETSALFPNIDAPELFGPNRPEIDDKRIDELFGQIDRQLDDKKNNDGKYLIALVVAVVVVIGIWIFIKIKQRNETETTGNAAN